MIEHLQWDSDFFGMRVGRAFFDLGENSQNIIMDEAKAAGFKLVYVMSPVEVAALSGCLFDRRIVFSYNLLDSDVKETRCTEVNEVVPELYELAFRSGEHSRFLNDSRIGEDNFSCMYSLWLENSVSGKFADKVFAYREDGKIVGFATLSFKNDTADIGLIAVNAAYGKSGIGTELINSCKSASFDAGLKLLNVATQTDNLRACSFYGKNGFFQSEVTYIYHLWL